MNIFSLFETKDVESVKLGIEVIKTLNKQKEFEDYFEIPFHNLTKTFQFFDEYEIKNEINILNKKITINDSLELGGLETVDKDFLKETTINGSLALSGLQTADKDFLKGTVINGYLALNGLQSADKDFLKGTTINGYLGLSGLETVDKEIIMKNINK